ncbi:hypothetical protein ACHAXT_006767 [Thalassiosira profunda]
MRIAVTPGGGGPKPKKPHKKTAKKPQPSHVTFVDRIHLKARGGTGGAGSQAYHRLGSYKKKPCGGHGGRGGNVYLVTDPQLSSLKMERHHFTGVDGGRGGPSGMNGKNGRDVFVRVPCGVVVRRVLDWSEVEEMYGEEMEEGESDDVEECAADADDVDAADETNNQTQGEDDSQQLEATSVDQNESIEDEDDDDFDEYLEHLQSSKRQRKRNRKRRGGGGGALPSDYDEVVDTGTRSHDGMYYWSPTESLYDEDGGLASTAYPDHNQSMRKTAFLADLDQPNQQLLVAAGGKSGVGNIAYANRPHFSNMEMHASKKAVPGQGATAFLELELKLIADVGLVGFPNAGKSSLLSAMSRARPKIASYPFTTLNPLVGSIQYKDGYRIAMADVPGLIDGAAQGRGRGTEFLRHIERTKALVYMVDGVGVDGRDPVNDLRILGNELREYGSSGIFGENELGGDEGEHGEEMRRRRREIMERPSLILANKMDLISEEEAGMGRREELLFQLARVAEEVGIVCMSDDVLGISARVTGEGLQGLSKRLRQVVKEVEST